MSQSLVGNVVMLILDPIADLFTRIRNGYMAHLDEVEVPYSRMKEALLRLLEQHQYVAAFQLAEKKGRKMFVVSLRYEGRRPAITRIERVSTPGRRMYVGAKEIAPVLGGMGIALISTPSGILTGSEARQKNVGGEYLGRVW